MTSEESWETPQFGLLDEFSTFYLNRRLNPSTPLDCGGLQRIYLTDAWGCCSDVCAVFGVNSLLTALAEGCWEQLGFSGHLPALWDAHPLLEK